MTSLMIAISEEHLSTVELLCKKSAEIYINDNKNKNAFDYAKKIKDVNYVNILNKYKKLKS
jgi:ankyrin repeat protein